ncbi:MAG: C10 family peptidase [Bacteroidia bacterium]
MKKFTSSFVAFCLGIGLVSAVPVNVNVAKQAAASFYRQQYANASSVDLTLAYTETTSKGEPAYYVFNVNSDDGFVIIAADDAIRPVIGYSNQGQFVMPEHGSNFDFWMQRCKRQIEYAKTKNLVATQTTKDEWNNAINNTLPKRDDKKFTSVSPLTTITWNQNPYPYNYFLPPTVTGSTSRSQCVTGCVATAMAQIMRFWSYPAHGLGYHIYNENTGMPYENSDNYGELRRNFAADNFNWSTSDMPLSPGSSRTVNADTAIARLMFDAGVSVDMDYDPNGSGAWVVAGDDSVCAQNSYVKFFGYDRHTIQGLYESNYTYSAWEQLIENELNKGRVVEYAGFDTVNGGHTWVCEGWTSGSDTTFYMNWGWAGMDNGNFTLNNLSVSGDNFSESTDEAVIGIQPPAACAHFVAAQPSICAGGSVTFTDQSLAYPGTSVTAWNWNFGDGGTSTSQSPSHTYSTPGIYTVTEIVTATNGSDTVVRPAYIVVNPSTGNALPLSQGFEGGTFPPSGWYLNNPNNWTTSGYSYGTIWQAKNPGGYGARSHSMVFNNSTYNPIGGQRQQIYTPSYDFSAITAGKLYFDVAYEPANNEYSDTLVIYYSLDCGQTFTQVYSKGGMTLGTTGDSSGTAAPDTALFRPSGTQWRTDTIHLPAAVNGQANVLFSFENHSYSGGPIYIDNVNIPAAPASIATITDNHSISVFPNPNNGVFTIEVKNEELRTNNTVEIYNMLGEKIYSEISAFSSPMTIDISNNAAGIYLYRIITEKGDLISSGKLVVQ